jgi:hypothetical protein
MPRSATDFKAGRNTLLRQIHRHLLAGTGAGGPVRSAKEGARWSLSRGRALPAGPLPREEVDGKLQTRVLKPTLFVPMTGRRKTAARCGLIRQIPPCATATSKVLLGEHRRAGRAGTTCGRPIWWSTGPRRSGKNNSSPSQTPIRAGGTRPPGAADRRPPGQAVSRSPCLSAARHPIGPECAADADAGDHLLR